MASMLNSLPTLWMLYFVLSIIVLITGWLGTRWLPSIVRWALVGMVAGLCWMPWSFHESATVTEGSYSGTAPAIIVAMMDVMRHRTGSALLAVLLAAIIGGAVGVLFASWRARRADTSHHDDTPAAEKGAHGKSERREPTL